MSLQIRDHGFINTFRKNQCPLPPFRFEITYVEGTCFHRCLSSFLSACAPWLLRRWEKQENEFLAKRCSHWFLILLRCQFPGFSRGLKMNGIGSSLPWQLLFCVNLPWRVSSELCSDHWLEGKWEICVVSSPFLLWWNPEPQMGDWGLGMGRQQKSVNELDPRLSQHSLSCKIWETILLPHTGSF